MANGETIHQQFYVFDVVLKEGGDYRFFGEVVSAFKKKSGKWRYVVENAEGILHIFSATQLELVQRAKEG